MDVIANGPIGRIVCRGCGLERLATIEHSDESLREQKSRPTTLIVRWSRVPPTAAELAALRRCYPEFGAVPASALMKQLGDQREFVIGTFVLGEAEYLRDLAAESGLDLRLEAAPSVPEL
jgi:hypothetical protein